MRQFIAETDNDGGAGVDWRNKPINHLANPSINTETKNATNLLEAFKTFANMNQSAFIGNKNYTLPGAIAVRNVVVRTYIDIKNVAEDIIKLFGTEGTDVPTWIKTANDLRNLYNSVNNKDNCNKGTNAHGKISIDVNTAAQAALTKLRNFHFDDPTTRIGKIKIVLEKCYTDLLTLQTAGHDPWLRADWQIQYYVILKATADKLTTLN